MPQYLALLRDGGFLYPARIRLWSAAFLVGFAAAILFLVLTAHGLNDYKGRPLGTDFSDVYTAGTLALDGSPGAAFDPARHYEQERANFGFDTPFYGWHYPPFFLAVASALSTLPYLPALVLWQAATLALYLVAMAHLLRGSGIEKGRMWLLCALAFPAVFVNLTHGQNGFLTAALFAGALATLDERPIVAGLLFGLVAYKPQFGILIPLALAANGRWKTFVSAAVIVGLLIVTATVLFGPEIWTAFLASTEFSRTAVLEQGGAGFEKMQCVFAAVRLAGGGIGVAYATQTAVSLTVAVAVTLVWRSRASAAAKGAALCLGALLATPYCMDYDMMLLAPAIALLAAEGSERGFLPYERAALAALWLVPIAARVVAGATHIPLGLGVMALAFAFAASRGLTKSSTRAAA